MGYKDENIKHRLGISLPFSGYSCPNCGEKIKVKATFVTCSKCKSVIDGDELKKFNK